MWECVNSSADLELQALRTYKVLLGQGKVWWDGLEVTMWAMVASIEDFPNHYCSTEHSDGVKMSDYGW